MAPQDYVKRARPKKTASRNTKKRKTKVNAKTPWFRICVALTLVCGFVFGLYTLQQNDLEAASPQVVQSQACTLQRPETAKIDAPNASATSAKKDPLPVLKEEEWAFIDALPEYSVEVDVEAIPDSERQYIMQCGSFRKSEQAEQLKANIAFAGLESAVYETNGANGRWYRVVLGPYERKREAEKERHQLRRNKVLGCKIR